MLGRKSMLLLSVGVELVIGDWVLEIEVLIPGGEFIGWISPSGLGRLGRSSCGGLGELRSLPSLPD